MDTHDNLDNQFDDNLRRAAANIAMPSPPSSEVFNRCIAELQSPAPARHWFSSGRAVLVSVLSAAAVIAFTTTVFFASRDGSPANAAMILARFEKQIQSGSVIDLTINSVHLDDASLDGHLTIGEDTVAGDLRLSVKDEPDQDPIEADFAMGLAPNEKWILLRKLHIPDAESIPMISALFPQGSETLITLPNDEKSGISTGLSSTREAFNSEKLIAVLEQVVHDNANQGTTIVQQPDGTVILTLPLGNDSVLASLRNSLGKSTNQLNIGVGAPVPSEEHPKKSGLSLNFSFGQSNSNSASDPATVDENDDQDDDAADADDSDDAGADDDSLHEFANSTLAIQYDPTADSIHSITITNIGPTNGSMNITIRDGEVDPTLLDASRLVTPATRKLDLGAIASVLKAFGGSSGNGQ